jgi:chitodextrinase
MTFSTSGITAFQVQYWNGSAWTDVPGGNVTGNNKVWRQFVFAPVTTDRIRVQVNAALNSFSRIVEIEAWTDASVTNVAPVARIGAPAVSVAGAGIAFSGAASSDPDGTVAGYAWDFGDGTTGSGAALVKAFAAPGVYTVTLTVTDAGGATNVASQMVTVTQTAIRNVALAANGGVATASSAFDARFPVASLIDGDRKGQTWGAGGGWNDATANAFPDWVQVSFGAVRTIGEINVYTLQDNYKAGAEPAATTLFLAGGATAYQVQYWDMANAVWVDVPGGNITGNYLVWRRFTFAPVSTDRIRIQVNAGLNGYSRLVEVEAWEAALP